MITLITGVPGSGKTLWTLANTKALSEKENRPVFYSGIPELSLDWHEIDAEKWFDAPANSIIVIDECQRLFRPRGNGAAVPQYVSELETHRHKGLDLVLITQHPMLVDSNVRRLVGKHQHVARRFGLQRATVFEYESCKDQPLAKVSTSVQRYEWKYPKEVFSYYKSAEVHTHKARLPKKIYVMAAAFVLTAGAVTMVVRHQVQKMNGTAPEDIALAQKTGSAVGPNGRTIEKNPYQYFEDHAPRIVGMAFTAPVYDEVTKPTTAPMPVACIASKSKCVCNSQQGTHLDMDDKTCRSIVAGGFFVDWQERREAVAGEPQADRKPQTAEPSSSPQPHPANEAKPSITLPAGQQPPVAQWQETKATAPL